LISGYNNILNTVAEIILMEIYSWSAKKTRIERIANAHTPVIQEVCAANV
jgi:hypothetical protein